jgi:hypothetical protein
MRPRSLMHLITIITTTIIIIIIIIIITVAQTHYFSEKSGSAGIQTRTSGSAGPGILTTRHKHHNLYIVRNDRKGHLRETSSR